MPRALRMVPLLGLCLLAPAPLAGQLAPLTVPRGLARFTLGGEFGTATERWLAGQRQPLAADFSRPALGSGFWSALRPADSLLQAITGDPAAALHLGATTARWQITAGTLNLGLAYGVTSRITLWGRLPITRTVVRSRISHDGSEATAGFNPADPVFGDGFGAGTDANFFAAFEQALTGLGAAIARGDYDADPGRKQLAQTTLAEGQLLRDRLRALLIEPGTASPFLPTTASAAGAALLGRVSALQATLGSLNIGGFTESPALPSAALDSTGFRRFVTDPDGQVAGNLETPTVFSMGDVELGATVALMDGLARSPEGRGVNLIGLVTVRLRTGLLDRPERFFDVGTGDRQPDLELGVAADLGAGRIGARAEASYNLQLAGDANVRIAPPGEVMPWARTRAAVTRNPGEVLSLGLHPYVRLAPGFGLVLGVTHRRKGMDQVSLLEGQEPIPGGPVELLAEDTERNWTTVSGMVSFAAPLATLAGAERLPVDGGFGVSRVVSASGGRTMATTTAHGFLRLYFRFP